MAWCFQCALPPLFILSHFNMDGLCKILFFYFNLIIKFFLNDLVLIKEKLILNSYKKLRLEEEGPK
jgi:hypothetical protein